MRAAPILAALALVTAGCSSSGHKAMTPAKDAASVVASLKAAGLPIGDITVYTADTDTNHLLGRPNGYLSKASFADTRIDSASAHDDTPGSVDLGGSVEVFSKSAGATARASYISKAQAAVPILGTEYDYTAGPVLLRISQALTPDQAAAYQKALG